MPFKQQEFKLPDSKFERINLENLISNKKLEPKIDKNESDYDNLRRLLLGKK